MAFEVHNNEYLIRGLMKCVCGKVWMLPVAIASFFPLSATINILYA